MHDLPTGTVTFLFSDIEGSTRLLDELGDDYAEMLAEHHRRMRAAFEPRGGVEVDTAGDAFFVAFERASDALAAAAAAQEALGEIEVRVRMGIHTGQPLLTETGYVGMDVHRATRIMSAGHGGQVLVSDATRALIDGTAGLADLGLHRLKDLTEPQRLWQLGAGEFPPLKALYETNLPVQPTPLVGRENELSRVLELLSESRLVTLTGAGGSGKTRLALQAAAELADDYTDGVWWVSLAALRDPELVEPTIAQVVGAKDGLVGHLRGKEMVLLLDNFEQLLDAAPQVAALMSEAPNLRVLATSRQRLGVSAEQEYAVPTMVPVEAVALFTARARQLRPDFEPDDAVAEICRRLDGLPLAIELAAARVKVLTPEQILDRLGHSLELLTRGARDAPERHQTLRTTIDWSYELLDEEEKRLFADLAIFAGSFDLDAVEAICDADVDALGALIDKSLLRATDEGRFFLLETIREYAGEKLESSGDAQELAWRHALHFLAEAERKELTAASRASPEAIEGLSADYDNFRAALSVFSQRGEGERQLRLAIALALFWTVRGHLTEGTKWLEGVVHDERHDPALRAKGLLYASTLWVRQADLERQRQHLEQALQLVSRAAEPELVARILHGLGNLACFQGDFDRAGELLAEAEQLHRELGNEERLVDIVSERGYLAMCQGEYGLAWRLSAEAAEADRALGSKHGLMQDIQNLAFIALLEGRMNEAGTHLRESLELALELGDVVYSAYNLLGFAALAADEGKCERAARLVGASAAMLASAGGFLEPAEKRLHARTEALLRDRLARDALAAERDAGAALTRDEAVELAVTSID